MKIPQLNKNIKKIVNVYQLNCINAKTPGFGDFLRGCFCLRQLSIILGIDFDIDISNHPISKYMKNINKVNGVNYNNIEFYIDNNTRNGKIICEDRLTNIHQDFIDNFVNWLNKQKSNVVGLFSNAFPLYNIYKPDGIEIIKSKFIPNDIMNDYINNSLKYLKLEKKRYGVIHIRTGDKYLVDNSPMNINFINKIKNILKSKILSNKRYLIISDSNILKSYLKDIPNFYILVKKIEHLGGESLRNPNSDGIKNTLLDFYLMSYSNSILSLSVYDHVSGFSKYCSILYNIPFKFIQIKE
jgi:hypothetical protein